MAGTGIHGYTGTSSDGKYNIVNGQIVSQNPTYSTPATTSGGYAIANRNGAVMNDATQNGFSVSDLSTMISNAVSSVMSAANTGLGSVSSDYAKQISNMVSQSNSDYADIVREILANQNANTAKSQAFAREQMDYQTRSDKAAMSWSAAEAQKNRDWQERLSDQAHQREVKDLIAAGLNPILSANAGAYTGSGATGQGFSSSGAMGNVDTSGTAAIGSLFNSIMTNAANTYIAGLYTQAERYNSDLQYSASRLATEASILNNQNSTSAQKAIASAQMSNDLEKTRIQGEYGLANTGLSNEGAMQRTIVGEAGETARANLHESAETKRTEYKTENGSFMNAGTWVGAGKKLGDLASLGIEKIKQFYKKSSGPNIVNGSKGSPSRLLQDIGWG